MGGKHPRQTAHTLKVVCSWALFLLVSLGGMFGVLARMAAAGPAGAVTRPLMLAQSGALAITVGSSPTITAPSAFLFDADTGAVYYAKGADDERPMASTTKIMTILLAVERGNLNQIVTIGPDAAALVRADSSYMGVSAGERISLGDLLYGLVLPSGNDAAIAIADAIAGSVPNFVELMNARARELG
nr:D-alanyl-D-alanine carboxypeptidase [Ktedonobacterales bacterium]